MASILKDFITRGVVKDYPSFLSDGLEYEVIMGSEAYGVSSCESDRDIYGFATPPVDYLFPSMRGEVEGFGPIGSRFAQFEAHHITNPSTRVELLSSTTGESSPRAARVECDFSVYNIAKYFLLTMNGNPNMVDSLFVPDRCVLYLSKVGSMVREKRNIFLSKKVWHTFKGYAYSSLHKLKTKEHKGLNELIEFEESHNISRSTTLQEVKEEIIRRNSGMGNITTLSYTELLAYHTMFEYASSLSSRVETIKAKQLDTKFGYHIVRLINEVEQILSEGDLDITRNREQLKSIRRGEWTADEIEGYFKNKEAELETLYTTSTLPYSPDVQAIHTLLLSCIEEKYGNFNSIPHSKSESTLLAEIDGILERYRYNERKLWYL